MFFTDFKKSLNTSAFKRSWLPVFVNAPFCSAVRYLPKTLIKTLTKGEGSAPPLVGSIPTLAARFNLRHLEINRSVRALTLLPVTSSQFYYVFLEKPFLWAQLLIEFHSYYRK